MPFILVMNSGCPEEAYQAAQNMPSSGDHAKARQSLLLGPVCAVHRTPSGLVRIAPENPTAQNKPRPAAQTTLCNEATTGEVREVQLIPSELVMINASLGVAAEATAQNKERSGDQQMLCHVALLGVLRTVHVIPSEEVIACDPAPDDSPTAQNRFRDEDQQTDLQGPLAAAVRAVHVIPSGLVATAAVVISADTVQNNRSSGDQHTSSKAYPSAP